MLVAFSVPDMESEHMVFAVVASMHNRLRTGVVCRRMRGDRTWEPLYLVDGSEKSPLPHCFSLNEEAVDALNNLMYIVPDEERPEW